MICVKVRGVVIKRTEREYFRARCPKCDGSGFVTWLEQVFGKEDFVKELDHWDSFGFKFISKEEYRREMLL